jgi:hypothetical protein
VCICLLALFPGWISQADLVPLLPRAPEFQNNVLCAGCSERAIRLRLTSSPDPALARQALGPDDQALIAVPDLARRASLLDRISRTGAGHFSVRDNTILDYARS